MKWGVSPVLFLFEASRVLTKDLFVVAAAEPYGDVREQNEEET
jgi:hypothetical protein